LSLHLALDIWNTLVCSINCRLGEMFHHLNQI
jgi:hypothetical protein